MIIHAPFSLDSLQIRWKEEKKRNISLKNRNVIFVCVFYFETWQSELRAQFQTDSSFKCVAIFAAMRKCVSIENEVCIYVSFIVVCVCFFVCLICSIYSNAKLKKNVKFYWPNHHGELTYSSRGGSFGTKIDTSASCGSQLPPSPYFPSIASNNDGMMGCLNVCGLF